MLQAAMRLPWLVEGSRVVVRVCVFKYVHCGDWQGTRRLRTSCRKQQTGIIRHSRPKQLKPQRSDSTKSDEAEGDTRTSRRRGWAPLTCNPSLFPAETEPPPAPPSFGGKL
ncbi:hypothetical protein XENOCAPTIV_022179 [Xenoophorus captivus]|uniref:Uncharacterized protein n=1 Tax=Xenoophorus captivus TaxID=1517983 RepID=A0ABV0RIH2_9TELE